MEKRRNEKEVLLEQLERLRRRKERRKDEDDYFDFESDDKFEDCIQEVDENVKNAAAVDENVKNAAAVDENVADVDKSAPDIDRDVAVVDKNVADVDRNVADVDRNADNALERPQSQNLSKADRSQCSDPYQMWFYTQDYK